MRALLQRVTFGSVKVDDEIVGKINNGMVVLLGVHVDDLEEDTKYLAGKCANVRIFNDENGNLNKSILETNGSALIISQFTLYGDARKGRRPGFSQAAPPEKANRLYELFIDEVRHLGIHVEHGVFGAMMKVEIHNDGPVTLLIESK